MSEEERKLLVIECYNNHWSKVVDIPSFKKYIGNCSFCIDAKVSCIADGKEITLHPPNYCAYCKGAKDICDGTNDDTVIKELWRLAEAGKEEELMAMIRKGLADYHDKWVI